jgi:hypothetical protein
MAERWLAQAKAKVESELCAQGFGRRAVKAAVARRWAAMEAKAATEASDPGAVARSSVAVDALLSPLAAWTVQQRDGAIAQLTYATLRDLERQRPGSHWVGATVKVQPARPPKRAGAGGSVKVPPADAAADAAAAEVGVVLSFDSAKQRFVVEVQASKGQKAKRALVTCGVDRVVLVAKREIARKEVAASQEALAADAATAQREKKLAASGVERWDAARLDAFAAGHTETVYVTHKSRGRLQTLAAAKAAEAEAATKRATRVKRQEKLRSLLATTARATKALKAQIAAAVAEARAAKVANPKADPEVLRLGALLFSHLNENVYTNLMRGSSASAGGDDSLDLDAIISFGGGAGGSGGDEAVASERFDVNQSGTFDAKEFAAALGAPVGIEASNATEMRASSAAENSEGGGEDDEEPRRGPEDGPPNGDEAGDEGNYGNDKNDDGEGEDQGS